MSGADRSGSRDRAAVAKLAHSWAENGRSSVPMWDSSDPERAPPPLPLNPGSQTPTTKANTSVAIAAAAQQIIDRARESTPLSSYTTTSTPQGSPERSLVKGAHHKRMQSLQPASSKDLRSYLDSNRSPERPTSRSSFTPYSREVSKDYVSPVPERSSTPTPTPSSRDPVKDTPTRPPPRPILGENTPPSSTMLALQTMQVPEDAFHDVTNRSGTPTTPRVSNSYDFSSQLLNLTKIATNLQKEMSAISRRSKDNATDLLSLKEATLTRDEDIRKSLRDLATNVTSSNLLGPPPDSGSGRRTASNFGARLLDSDAFSSPPSAAKPWTMPRASSVPSMADDARIGPPSPYSVEGAASIAMLEKIIREMVTKEGQEHLLGTLSELFTKSSKESVEAAKKVEQLADFIKDKSASSALVPITQSASGAPKLNLAFDSPAAEARVRGIAADGQKTIHDEEILKLLQRIKDSISHAGGATAEVKGLVRDMRGEVLGMGRELGRKLDQVSESQLSQSLDRSIEDGQGNQQAEEMHRIVEEGLAELKEHFSSLLKERAASDDDALQQLAAARSGPDGDEVYAVVKHALAEHGETLAKQPVLAENSGIDRDGVLDAVKEGLKDFEPNIELQQFGLERDEILAVLKEGLEDYQKGKPEPAASGVDKGELYEMMQEALKDFQPGISAEHIQLMKDEMAANVREALIDFRAAPSASVLDDESMRMAVVEAVKEGLINHGPAAPREIEISRDDLFDAVQSSLDGTSIPFNSFGERVLQQLSELVDGMRIEFKQYSTASGRDTEQVLDAVKDGLESLRAEIESYVDRAQDVTGKDEIVDTVKTGLEQLRVDVQGYCLQGSSHDSSKADLLDYIKAEFEHLHEAIGNTREVDEARPERANEIILAITQGFEELKIRAGSRDFDGEADESKEEMIETMKDEFDQLKAAMLTAHAADKSELNETVQDSMGALYAKLTGSDISNLSNGAVEDIIQVLREELAHMKESLVTSMGEADRDAIVAGVKLSIDDLRIQLAADQGDASAETLSMMKEELERFRDAIGSSMVLSSGAESTLALVAIRERLDEIKETTAKSSESSEVSEELLEAIRGEFENLRTSIGRSNAQSGSNEEVLDTIRVGLDDLRSNLEKKFDSPERGQAQQNELLDVMSEGLDTLRADVVKTLDKPLDMTVNYEILDTLKEGLTALRAELDVLKHSQAGVLKSNEIVLAEGAVIGEASRDVMPEEATAAAGQPGVRRSDLERMEVLLAQLQIKIEAMNVSVQDAAISNSKASAPAEGTALKADLEGIENSLKDLQETVLVLAERELPAPPAPEGVATKEDTDAIETLLRNAKAQIDELVFPDPACAVTKEHIDVVEGLITVTNDAVEGLKDKLECTTAAKADVAAVEILAQDVKTMLEEVREKIIAGPSEDELATRMTKADLDVLGILCTEIKTKVVAMDLPDPAELPSKADVEQLQGLIADFRESHDKMKDSYEGDIAVTAKAFDDRKLEFESTVKQIEEVKAALMEAKDELMERLDDGESGVNTLGETLKSLEEKTSNEGVIVEVQEILETVRAEFEKAHGSLEALKLDHEQNATIALEKQGEHREAVVTELGARLDTVFDGLMSKYDDAQAAAMENARALEERNAAQEELFNSTKEMTDDLKLSIDTLGTALTTFTATYPDTMEKLAQDSKIVFNRVDDAYNKLDETQLGLQHEHTVTREEVGKVMAGVQAVQSDLTEHNPRFMVSLKEVQALVSQHYEHSQKASNAAAQHAQAVRDLQDALKSGFEEAKGHHASQTEELKGALPALLPAPSEGGHAIHQAYDDGAVHEKLDQLMGHVKQAADPAVKLERLDSIHDKLVATAAEVSALVALQAKQITQDHEGKEKEAEEVANLLERRLVQQEQIEAEITVLQEEKDFAHTAVQALKAELEDLTAQKSRLAADVSSLKTALHIRREELHTMDAKAEAIERRMLEGVMNQSRMLLLAKAPRASSPTKKKPQGRDLRVPSTASAVSSMAASTLPDIQASHALAMKSRPAATRNGPSLNQAERRIMSLSQINHNVPTGAHAFSPTPSLVNRGPMAMKRSHSVKTGYMRKPSWSNAAKQRSLSEYNKENETLSEQDEEEEMDRDDEHGDFESEAGTERRASFATRTDGDESLDERSSYVDDITPGTEDGRRSSYGTSALTYGTGSYLTGSELDDRTSLGSTADGIVGVNSSMAGDSIEDDDGFETPDEEAQAQLGAGRESGAHDGVEEPLKTEAPSAKPPQQLAGLHKSVYAPHSDSGLGTDIPTAALSPSDHTGYFQS